MPHVIAHTSIAGNGGSGIFVAKDVFQGTLHAYRDIGIWIVGNSIENNGQGGSGGGGIITDGSTHLSRSIFILDNIIDSNDAKGYVMGAAISLSLNGATTQSSRFSGTLASATIRDGFGTLSSMQSFWVMCAGILNEFCYTIVIYFLRCE